MYRHRCVSNMSTFCFVTSQRIIFFFKFIHSRNKTCFPNFLPIVSAITVSFFHAACSPLNDDCPNQWVKSVFNTFIWVARSGKEHLGRDVTGSRTGRFYVSVTAFCLLGQYSRDSQRCGTGHGERAMLPSRGSNLDWPPAISQLQTPSQTLICLFL